VILYRFPLVQAVQPTRLFFACFGRPGQRSVASPIARGAKGSIRADTKIYIVRFNGGAQNDNPSISLGLACLIQLEHVKKWISVLISIFHNVSQRGTVVVRRTAPVQEARRRIGSAESKHGSSTSSWESGGGCTTYVWAQKCPEGWCREHANNLCHPKDASMFRHSRAFRSHTWCESSVILHFWCPQINPNVGMLRCEQ